MEWSVLGPLQVRSAAGVTVTPTGPVRRVLLAALLSRANQTVSAGTLAEDVWGQLPPRSAAKTLQSHLVRLRDDLGRDEIESVLLTEPAGYRLAVAAEDFDAALFVSLTELASSQVASGQSAPAMATFDRAQTLWRGEAFEDFADAAFTVGERQRLSELRAFALEQRTDLALSAGQAAELVAELEQRVAMTPYRERSWEQLVVALYRAGRQADALGCYRRARDLLAADLGVDPGPGLVALETQILRHDPALVEGRSLTSLWGATAPTSASTACPYRGLSGYGDEDAGLFVGRERLTARIAGHLVENQAVVVTGASGAGKSSLVRAGLLPSLRAGALPGSAAWRSVVVTPAAGPCEGAVDLVVVDQTEELFGVVGDEQRRAFVGWLAQQVEHGTRVLLVVRGDVFGRLAEVPPLDAYASAATVLVGPLRDDELTRVVLEPAARSGLTVEHAVVEAVLDDVAGQPAALPMVSVALVRAWENRSEDTLTHEGYRAGGGVTGAVEAAAEECLRRLDGEAQLAARHLLVRLVAREGTSWARSPLSLGAVDAAAGPAARRALDVLVEGRLVVLGGDRVELAHDALFEHWPRMRGWLEEREYDADLVQHLAQATHAWASTGRSDADLYRGTRLQAALDWQALHPAEASPSEADFLAASAASARAELHAERARADLEAAGRRRLRRVVVALVAASAVTLALGGAAFAERSTARHQAQRADAEALTADARRLAALAVTAPDLRTSLLLAAAAFRLQDTSDTRSALLSTLEKDGSALFHVGAPERVQWVGVSPDGSQLWVADALHVVTHYDLDTLSVTGSFLAPADHVAALSPDARRLVVVGPATFADRAGATRGSLLDAHTGEVLDALSRPAAGSLDDPAVFTGDGRWLAVVDASGQDGSPGASLSIYDAHHPDVRPRQLSVGATVVGVAAGRDCLATLTARGDVGVWHAATLRTTATARHPELVSSGQDPQPFAVSPDCSHLASVSPALNHVPLVLATAHLGEPGRPTEDLGAAVDRLAFSPSSALVAAGANSGAVAVFHTDGSLAVRTVGGTGPVRGLAWSGSTTDAGLFSGGLDSQVVGWDLHNGTRLIRLRGRPIPAVDAILPARHEIVGLSPAQGSGPESKESLAILDLSSGTDHSWPLDLRDDESVAQVVTDASERTALLTIDESDGTIRCELRSTVSGRLLGAFVPTRAPNPHQTFVAAISPDGRSAVVSIGARRLGVYSLPDGRQRATYDVRFSGTDGDRVLATPWVFAPDGRLLVVGYDPGPPLVASDAGGSATDHSRADQRVALVDARTGHVSSEVRLGPLGLVSPLAWSSDGSRLAMGAIDGRLWLVDGRTLDLLAGPVNAVSGTVSSVSFARDGRMLVASGSDGTLSFWDGRSLRPIGAPLHAASDGSWAAYFRADGDVTGLAPTDDPQQQSWFTLPGSPQEWVRLACQVAGPALSKSEWARFVGARPYRRTC